MAGKELLKDPSGYKRVRGESRKILGHNDRYVKESAINLGNEKIIVKFNDHIRRLTLGYLKEQEEGFGRFLPFKGPPNPVKSEGRVIIENPSIHKRRSIEEIISSRESKEVVGVSKGKNGDGRNSEEERIVFEELQSKQREIIIDSLWKENGRMPDDSVTGSG